MGNMILLLTFCCCMWVFTAQGKNTSFPVGYVSNVRTTCRCEKKNCDDTGRCVKGSKCEQGWFGGRCQYVDLASNPSDILTDGDDTTCFPGADIAIADLPGLVPFYWLRIVSAKVSLKGSENLEVYFHNSENSGVPSVIKCSGLKATLVNNQTLDISCDLSVTVNQVVLSGDGVRKLCSIYVSGACQSGFYGPNCKNNCSLFCLDRDCDPVSGDCIFCQPGFQGRLCNQACDPTFYGQKCAKKCPVNCLDQLCYPENGKCIQCVDGWTGDQCDKKKP